MYGVCDRRDTPYAAIIDIIKLRYSKKWFKAFGSFVFFEIRSIRFLNVSNFCHISINVRSSPYIVQHVYNAHAHDEFLERIFLKNIFND